MKMNKKASVIATSVAAIALSSSLIAGSTFALFTSESKVNIAVTSAKVKVEARVDKNSLEVSSTLDAPFVAASFDAKDNLILDNMAAGDSVSVKIGVTNYSTISVKYKASVIIEDAEDDSLSEVLEVTTTSENGISYDGLWKPLGAASSKDGDNVDTLTVEVTLPEAVTDHMGETCTVSFLVEAVQGNAEVTNVIASKEDFDTAIVIGGNIELVEDITNDTITGCDFVSDKVIVIDMNGKTFTGDNNNISARVNSGEVTFENGVITAAAGTYCTVSAAKGGTAYLKNMTLNNSTAWGNSVKAFATGTINLYDTEVNSYMGGGCEAAGGTINIYDGCVFTQAGAYDHNSTNVSASGGGEVNVYGGIFQSANYGAYVFNSGATINIYDGAFSANVVLKADKSITSDDSVINVYGGTFEGSLAIAKGATLNVSGGKFTDANVAKYLAEGYGVAASVDENGDTWYTVYEQQVKTLDFKDEAKTLQLLCPDCVNHPETDHNDHTGIGAAVKVDEERGVLQIISNSAFATFEADWANYKYTLSNTVDLSGLDEGDYIVFDSGLTNPWANDMLIAIKKVDGKLYVKATSSNFTPSDKDYVLTSEKVDFVWTYETDENGKLIATSSIEGHIVQTTKGVVSVNPAHQIQWQIYLPATNESGKVLAEVSDFKVVGDLK